jgi:tetratricopeptide (TPR) repeat protein/tRNA A-37 threonylcarbamoyl transferase component Bud32
MSPERWQQVKDVCNRIRECEPQQREARLLELCRGDEDLRREVEKMLAQANGSAGILDAPVCEKPGLELTQTAAAGGGPSVRWLPETIGSYRVLRLVGEGGMGAVYEAQQDHPRRTVALKVIRPGLTSSVLLRRFSLESQALGRLQHPGIAQIYEAGTADTGFGPQPYFAMEFIRGEALREYADRRQLTTRQRLELVARICDAVEHAHQRGLIHRDLKPGNILVDEMGQPKILDFGVARLTDSDAQATRQTDLGQLVGTLAYMSPEQVLADPLELDTRSDVYALGVILYELLAKRLPYTISNKLHEAVRTIREEDPERLSSVSRTYRGDIETIVAKALEKDKARRYASAAALGEDIRRYLRDEPIEARPATTTYQLQKFARRHRALVGGVGAVFVVLVAGVVVSTWQAVRARRAERAAVEAQQTAQAVNDFLQNDLLAQASAATQAGPNQRPDPDLKVRTALDRAAARIGGKFGNQPEVEASIRATVGQAYKDLGLYSEAQTQLERALDLQRRVFGLNHQASLRTMGRLASNAISKGKYPEAEALLNQVVEGQKRVLGPGDRETLGSVNLLALVYYYQGKNAQAESLMAQTLETRRRQFGSEDRDTLASMNNLANVYSVQGKHSLAETLDSQTLEIRRRVMGPEHPETLTSMNNLARDYAYQSKYEAAETLYKQAYEIQRRVLGPAHADTLRSAGNLAGNYGEQGKNAEAAALLSETLETQRRVLGSEHRSTLLTAQNLALTYSAQRKYSEAEALFRQNVQTARRVLGPEHPLTLAFQGDLGDMYQRQGKFQLAGSHAAQVLAGRRRALGSNNTNTMSSAMLLSLAYISQGLFDAAEPLAREALDFGRKQQPKEWETFFAESLVGASLAGQKKYAEAEPLLVEGYTGMIGRKMDASASAVYYFDRAGEWVVKLYQAWGRPDKATEWRRKLAAGSGKTRERAGSNDRR